MPISAKTITKFYRDLLTHTLGTNDAGQVVFDPLNPIGGHLLRARVDSPICSKCGLHEHGATRPCIQYQGPDQPLVTVVTEAVSAREDASNELASAGSAGFLRNVIKELAVHVGISLDQIRWVPLTRCAAVDGKHPNYKTHGNWCRHYLVQDLRLHQPRVIIPVGSSVLGLMSHKSSAQDWSGRLLTWRGWPDDWLTDPEFVLERPDPAGSTNRITGHPVYGPKPEGIRVPMVPIQAPRIVFSTQNSRVIARWKEHLKTALVIARDGVPAPKYDRPWFELTENPSRVEQMLQYLIDHPKTLVCYDTETTGLKPWAEGQSIVFMMFRWDDDRGNPVALGFPWDYAESALKPYINRLAPTILKALYSSIIVGHNTTFDIMFTAANVPGCDLNKLCNAAVYDTWHMAYTARQQTGSLGLELIAYDWAPDMAGYEEDMTLLIDLHGDKLNPENGNGGHYANCPRELWDSHFKPYVMGDVEVCYRAYEGINQRLQDCRRYAIPLAHPTRRGQFRRFTPPSRAWVYQNVVSPASRVLMKMMGRGMHVDQDELERQEDIFPKKIRECLGKIKEVTPEVAEWCKQMVDTTEVDPSTNLGWELDPENRDHLRHILFTLLKLPIQRLTDSGRKLYSDETPEDIAEIPRDEAIKYAALDKFTLNKLSVSHSEVRPLQDYRKVHKQYTTYVRPMRNAFTQGIDKKHRLRIQHLARDGKVHATFKLTGTRGGRLSCVDPNLQQLPRDGLVKRLYTSRFGDAGAIYQADLSQIELRLLAAACGDEAMVRAYHSGVDLHSLTHSNIYGKPYDECTNDFVAILQSKGRDKEAKQIKEERKVAKCLDPYTLVSVDGQIMRIGELHHGREPDRFYDLATQRTVQTPGGRRQPIRQFYCNGEQPRLLVVMQNTVLVCSPTHKFQLHDGSLLPAKELSNGMILRDTEALAGTNTAVKLHKIFELLGQLGQKHAAGERHLEFPGWLFNADRASKLAFLAGFVELTGAVSPRGTATVKFTSWKTCQDFCVLAKSANLDCAVSGKLKTPRGGGAKLVELTVDIIGRTFDLAPWWLNKRACKSPRQAAQRSKTNKVMRIYHLPAGVLVDIAIDAPHIHVPNGVATHQTVNFLTGYGGGGYGLQTSLAQQGIYKELDECEQILEAFFDAYPALRTYLSYYKRFIAENGVAVSILGRVRIFEEVFSDDKEAISKALRAGCNHLIQSTASDIMLVLLCVIESLMEAENLESLLMTTVHDSLAVDAKRHELDRVHDIVYPVMNNIPEVLQLVFGPEYDTSWMIVPLAADCQVGLNYLDAKEIPESGRPDWEALLAHKAEP